jgi:hypothetical protein
LGARIVDGEAEIAVGFELGIKDSVLTGSIGNRRILLSSDPGGLLDNFFDNLDISLIGTIDAALPVYFPTESIYRGDIKIGGALSLTPDGFDVTGTVGPSGTDSSRSRPRSSRSTSPSSARCRTCC